MAGEWCTCFGCQVQYSSDDPAAVSRGDQGFCTAGCRDSFDDGGVLDAVVGESLDQGDFADLPEEDAEEPESSL